MNYEKRMEEDLDEIRNEVGDVIERVEGQLQDAVKALLDDRIELANQVILGDRLVNGQIRQIDQLCHAFIVRHAPSAGHLRYVSAVLRFNIALERVGDYASTIGREVVQLSGMPSGQVSRDIELISKQSRMSFAQALKSFRNADVAMARNTHGLSEQTDAVLENTFSDLIAVGERQEMSLRDIFGLLRIINLLKRVAEQADNICEHTVFAYTGKLDPPKVFRVLFLDQLNNCASQIAEGYARKAFPESGEYASAGISSVTELGPGLKEFLDQNGIDVHRKYPKKFRSLDGVIPHYHIVVVLENGIREHIQHIPFRTVLLEWDLGIEKTDLEEKWTEEQFAELFQEIAHRVRDLMQTLRGPRAR